MDDVNHTITADGGMLLSDDNSEIEFSPSQVEQASEIQIQALTDPFSFESNEFSLRVKPGERHPLDIVLQFANDRESICLAQIRDSKLHRINSNLSALREWCALTFVD